MRLTFTHLRWNAMEALRITVNNLSFTLSGFFFHEFIYNSQFKISQLLYNGSDCASVSLMSKNNIPKPSSIQAIAKLNWLAIIKSGTVNNFKFWNRSQSLKAQVIFSVDHVCYGQHLPVFPQHIFISPLVLSGQRPKLKSCQDRLA